MPILQTSAANEQMLCLTQKGGNSKSCLNFCLFWITSSWLLLSALPSWCSRETPYKNDVKKHFSLQLWQRCTKNPTWIAFSISQAQNLVLGAVLRIYPSKPPSHLLPISMFGQALSWGKHCHARNRDRKQQYLYRSIVVGFTDKQEAKKIHTASCILLL